MRKCLLLLFLVCSSAMGAFVPSMQSHAPPLPWTKQWAETTPVAYSTVQYFTN